MGVHGVHPLSVAAQARTGRFHVQDWTSRILGCSFAVAMPLGRLPCPPTRYSHISICFAPRASETMESPCVPKLLLVALRVRPRVAGRHWRWALCSYAPCGATMSARARLIEHGASALVSTVEYAFARRAVELKQPLGCRPDPKGECWHRTRLEASIYVLRRWLASGQQLPSDQRRRVLKKEGLHSFTKVSKLVGRPHLRTQQTGWRRHVARLCPECSQHARKRYSTAYADT